jgi:hypothetical protein
MNKSKYLCSRNQKKGCEDIIKHRGVEQLVARQAHNLEVARSNPASATK